MICIARDNVTLQHIHWGSAILAATFDLKAHTTMLQVDAPLSDGRMFFRSDLVNSGCRFVCHQRHLRSQMGDLCRNAMSWQHQSDVKRRKRGRGLARIKPAWDIGTTPMGFDVVDVVGGVSHSNDSVLSATPLTPTVARSSSLLAFAGQRHQYRHHTGRVRATGGGVSISYDKGEANGIWSA